jgi:pyruvate/2-oxoglutarate dehydrogenase complex dihydrolipoamide acyltransferase (E2) component
MSHDVIMPALGMAQDTGLIVTWHKAVGDEVKADDILMEVETDKATMEVEAGHDGYIAQLHAAAGDDVPVGDVIAIISKEKPTASSASSMSAAKPSTAKVVKAVANTVAHSSAPVKKTPIQPSGGRILSSPKARRLAQERGLDLSRLVAEGVEQPYHVSDIETLASLPSESTVGAASISRLNARVPSSDFNDFTTWLTEETPNLSLASIWASFACASLRPTLESPSVAIVVVVDDQKFSNADLHRFKNLSPTEENISPLLLLRDLTETRISTVQLSQETTPTITITRLASAQELELILEFSGSALTNSAAIQLLNGFAQRIETPLRHLL